MLSHPVCRSNAGPAEAGTPIIAEAGTPIIAEAGIPIIGISELTFIIHQAVLLTSDLSLYHKDDSFRVFISVLSVFFRRSSNPTSVVKNWSPGLRLGSALSRRKPGLQCTIGIGLL